MVTSLFLLEQGLKLLLILALVILEITSSHSSG